jgi:hypothetical protein
MNHVNTQFSAKRKGKNPLSNFSYSGGSKQSAQTGEALQTFRIAVVSFSVAWVVYPKNPSRFEDILDFS